MHHIRFLCDLSTSTSSPLQNSRRMLEVNNWQINDWQGTVLMSWATACQYITSHLAMIVLFSQFFDLHSTRADYTFNHYSGMTLQLYNKSCMWGKAWQFFFCWCFTNWHQSISYLTFIFKYVSQYITRTEPKPPNCNSGNRWGRSLCWRLVFFLYEVALVGN